MTQTTPPRSPGSQPTAQAWRGIAAEDADDITGEPGVAAAAARPGACCRTCSARTGGRVADDPAADRDRQPRPPWPGRGWSASASTGIPPLTARTTRCRWRSSSPRSPSAVAVQAVTTRAFIGAHRQPRRRRGARAPAPAVRPLPAAAGRRSTSTTPPAGSSPGRSPTSTRSPTCSTRAWTRWSPRCFSLLLVGAGMLLLDWPLALVVLAGFVPLAWLTGLVPARVGGRLPADPGDDRPGHRAVRGDLRRHPRGPGVPPGAPERGDLRRAQRGLRGGQPALAPG